MVSLDVTKFLVKHTVCSHFLRIGICRRQVKGKRGSQKLQELQKAKLNRNSASQWPRGKQRKESHKRPRIWYGLSESNIANIRAKTKLMESKEPTATLSLTDT